MNWDQLKTILWLRWRLTRNQWMRSGGLGAAISLIVAVAALGMIAITFIAALLVGALVLDHVSSQVMMWVWFGLTMFFLLSWTVGLLAELQRSETIDLQRLMHLPVALGQMFVINYLASHLAFSVFLAVPAMIGLAIGLAVTRSASFLLVAPLALSMVFMVSAWTYCLRGWLAAMMTNPRRRRTVIMVITLAFVLIGQGPNLYFNVMRRDHIAPPRNLKQSQEAQRQRAAQQAALEGKLNQIIAFQGLLPPLWVPVGAEALAEGRAWPAMAGFLGCCGLGVLGLRRAYRSTIRFYHGETGGKAPAPIKPAPSTAIASAPQKTDAGLLEMRPPLVPEQAAVIALASFRSTLRAPEVKLAWGTSFLVTLILGATFFFRSGQRLPEIGRPFAVIAVTGFSLFTLVQFLANQFGFDRDGFRALVLSPVDRRLILLGKNLACLPIVAGSGGLLLVLAIFWLRLEPAAAVAALFQLAALLLLTGLGGNLLSILVPYRIQQGSMKPTKLPGLAMLVMVLCQMLFPMLMLPVFVPPLAELVWRKLGGAAGVPVNLALSITLAAIAGLAYWLLLAPMGRLLQRRETIILEKVTAEVE